jgi:hypothetical protein
MTTNPSWLDEAVARQATALQALQLRIDGVLRTVASAGKAAALAARNHDEAAENRAPRSPIDHTRVVRLVRAGSVAELTDAEVRYAAVLFEELSPTELLPVLQWRRRGWRSLATRCFREWEQFFDNDHQQAFANLFREAPADALRVNVGLDASVLLAGSGPANVAARLKAITEPRLFKEALEEAGFSWRWEFTAHVVVFWFARHPLPWDQRIEQVLAVDELRWTLLPPESKEDSGRVRSSMKVRTRIVAAILKEWATGNVSNLLFDELSQRLLASDFGDARIPPLSEPWARVRAAAPEAFGKFLNRLIGDDLRFFFQIVRGDRDRLNFWEKQLHKLEGAFCVLDPDAFSYVSRSLRASDDPKSARALERVKKARRNGTPKVQAFVLLFEGIVVVEFSESGNAAYIFRRAEFERRVLPQVHDGIHETTDLKRSMAHLERILHNGNWQYRAAELIDACERHVGEGR